MAEIQQQFTKIAESESMKVFLTPVCKQKVSGEEDIRYYTLKGQGKDSGHRSTKVFYFHHRIFLLTISLLGRAKDPLIPPSLHAGTPDQMMAMTPRDTNSRHTNLSSHLSHHMLRDHRDNPSNHRKYCRSPHHLRMIRRRPSRVMTRRQSTSPVCFSHHCRKRLH